ncbi:MAG: ATP-dependent Clp protease proteolytic subunit [Thermorudis peleae]|nr:ATP-dependent Clp protease proteolytic subunit [Thermorudis peleae]
MDIVGFLFWILLLFSIVAPAVQRRWLEAQRYRLIHAIERKRGSRVITLIHRQESISFLGIPLARYIDIDDAEEILRAIRLTPDDLPIDLIVHTPGGLVLAAEQIANALIRHQGKVTVFVPHYAMSGGTLIALAADEIVMDENAVLGPVDPQLGQYPAASILKVLEQKPPAEIDDQTLILADMSAKALRQVRETVFQILTANGMPAEQAAKLAEELTCGQWTHDYPITVEEARKLGLPVQTGIPEEVYALMDLYPQAAQRRPSVQYIPLPYQPPERGRRTAPSRGGRG